MFSIGAYVTFTVTVTDNKDPSPTVTVSPTSGRYFPVGTTTVTVTATDWKGNTATKTFDVTVLPFTQTILPPSGVRTYKAYWFDAYSSYFEWDITVAADGTVSGTGVQTGLLLAYDEFDQYSTELPSGLSGAGTVSGTIASDGSGQLVSSTSYWYWNGIDYDEGGNPAYSLATAEFSGAVNVIVDAAGNLYFDPNPIASPSYWYDYSAWYVQ
jgi:hypothetical protein